MFIQLFKTLTVDSLKTPFSPLAFFMVTQFFWPRLLFPFWNIFCHFGILLSPTSGCPCLPSEQTFTVSNFSISKGCKHSLRTNVSNRPCPQWPNIHVQQKWQVTIDGRETRMWRCSMVLSVEMDWKMRSQNISTISPFCQNEEARSAGKGFDSNKSKTKVKQTYYMCYPESQAINPNQEREVNEKVRQREKINT